MLIVAGIWAFLALRDRPFIEYAAIFFVCAILAILAEVTTLRLLHRYEWHMQMLAGGEADQMTASIVIAWLNPLLGLLYARYCQPRPILKAFLASLMLGCIEILLVKTGYFVYHSWSPVWTAGLFFAYFLVIWRVSLIAAQIPVWVHLLGFIMWISLLLDIPLQGIWWLWHFQVTFSGDIVRDNRLFSAIPIFLILTPCALAVSLAKARKLAWAIAGIALLLLIEAAALVTGFLIYDHWSLGWSALKDAVVIFAAVAYLRWASQGADRAPRDIG